jgi:predicted ArsR family transcriptional regulator
MQYNRGMKTRRQILLDYIKARGSATPAEIARALKMSPTNVRHHLSILKDQGSIQVSGELPAESRGRPAYVYSLTSQAGLHNLDRLAGLLLDEVMDTLAAGSQSILERVARRLAGEAPAESKAGLAQRLALAVARLNELNYQARWEAHATSPHIILGHCPFAPIIAAHPELCRVDAAMIETWLKTSVEQAAKLAPDQRGGRHCVFVLKPPAPVS